MNTTFLADGHLAAAWGIAVTMDPGKDGDDLNGGLQVQKWLDGLFALRSCAYVDSADRNEILGWSISPMIR